MSYIFSNILPYQTDEVDLFSDDDMDGDIQPIPREDYERLIEFLQNYNPPAILPIQIAYYAGLRIGEACGLAWQGGTPSSAFATCKTCLPKPRRFSL